MDAHYAERLAWKLEMARSQRRFDLATGVVWLAPRDDFKARIRHAMTRSGELIAESRRLRGASASLCEASASLLLATRRGH